MKKHILIIATVFIALQLHAQTYVGGLISTNTTWAQSGSPYIVTQNILVNTGVTLTIESNVTVKMDTGITILVRGTLRAIGIATGYITFTSNVDTPYYGDWANITFDNESTPYDTVTHSGCTMQYCTIEYGGRIQTAYPDEYGTVQAVGAYPYIHNCTFRKNLGNCIWYTNYNITHFMDISDNLFQNNIGFLGFSQFAGCAIKILDARQGSVERIKNNVIQNNGDGIAPFSGITIQQGQHLECSYNKIVNNTFKSDYAVLFIMTEDGYAIKNLLCSNTGSDMAYVQEGTLPNFKNNIIANNKCNRIFAASGFSWQPFEGIISNNAFVNNLCYWNQMTAVCMNTSFVHNTITMNEDTISPYYGGTEFYVLQGYEPQYFTLSGNNIHDNYSLNPEPFYNFGFNSTSTQPDFDASQNWWGSSDQTTVNNGIYDFFDNFTLGVINASPFLTTPDIIAPISPPMHVLKTDLGGGNIKIEWDPNLETDLSGYKIYWHTSDCCFFDNVLDVGNTTSHTFSAANFSDVYAVTAYDNALDGTDDQFDGNESWYSYDQTCNLTPVKNIPTSATTLKNFPNPFTTLTTIQFSLDKTSATSLEVFDVNGQPMKSLLDNKLLPAGSHHINFEASGFPSGLYYYILRTDAKTDIGKMILMR
ncbi:MAG TPA: T9SS type A sorting domain-containing protein [Chitinophagales bacterium]|nr:T9SS type A sorting domain-containing protein [Chitinophagales bacterium]